MREDHGKMHSDRTKTNKLQNIYFFVNDKKYKYFFD